MIVKCIDNSKVEGNLKLKAEYVVEEESKDKYTITLGNGVKGTYLKTRFKKVN